MFHLCGGIWECVNCNRIYCMCVVHNCYSCGYPRKTLNRQIKMVLTNEEIYDKLSLYYTEINSLLQEI